MLIADQDEGLLVDIGDTRGSTLNAYTPSLKDLVMVTGNLIVPEVSSPDVRVYFMERELTSRRCPS